MEILIITGPPYSGKGTQCDILKEQLDFTHISTGDISNERLKFKGFGDTKPIASNDNSDGRQSNRRVEITVLGK